MPFSLFSKKSGSSIPQSQSKSKSSKSALAQYSPAQVSSRTDQGYQLLSDHKHGGKKPQKAIGAVLNAQI
jgi:hypothetical protein